MVRREPQLVIFTIFTQMAVGTLTVWGLGNVLFPRQYFTQELGFFQSIWSVVMLSLILGVIAAFLHLGHPLRSIFALRNIGRSWLSREAFSGLVFGFLVLMLLLFYRPGSGLMGLTRMITLLGILSGLWLTQTISRLYRLRTVQVWNHPGTPITFFTSSILLGILANIAVCIYYENFWLRVDQSYDLRWMQLLNLAVLVLVILQLVSRFVTLIYLHAKGGKAADSIKLTWDKLRGLLILRWVIAITGGVILSWYRGNFEISDSTGTLLVFLSLALIFTSEIIDRWIFYGSYQREGF